ncbi:sensor domain-containing protein [Mycolicibacterium sp. HK-90]|uniref:sensor domain-containing protein n=1 Tax=Mycolicibacterium sp. HK-90 TaxID=3056937 RepID=UPI00265AAFB0|nr:sensor domain-containing protein [Mycolicibacterium sp. HK-90]WKG02642.1 sensor domain-containing protein [Mycolicibacterium sp. HK-90]
MSDDAKSLSHSAERWLSLAALVVAPTSLITGLCYFFGLLFIRNRLQYFGVDPATLGYTSADYAVTTIGIFFFAALRVLIVLAVLVVLAVAVRRWVATGRRIPLLRSISWLLIALGAAGLAVAVVWLAAEYSLIDWVVEDAGPMYMAGVIVAGIALLAAGYWVLALTGGIGGLGRLPILAERVLLGLAVTGLVVALFWVTDMYAAEQGTRNGAFTAANLWPADGDYTAVQLDTTEALNLPGDLVKVTVLPAQGPPAPPVYRYQCLRVLEAHGGSYVLVPARWSRERGYAITLTPDATHRVTAVVNSTPVAKGPSIDPFWQCPELVRTYHKADLEPILIGPEDAQTIANTGSLRAVGPDGDTAPATSGAMAKDCASEDVPSALPPFPEDVAATREREMTSEGRRTWLRQRAMIFPSPAAAEDYLARVQDHWGYCAGKAAAVDRHGAAQTRTLGSPGLQAGILSMPDSAAADTTPDCTQALTAKSNIVIAVDLCGTDESSRAIAVAYAVRSRIPTDY